MKDSCASAAVLEERPGTNLTEKKDKNDKDKLATGNLMCCLFCNSFPNTLIHKWHAIHAEAMMFFRTFFKKKIGK